MKISGEHSLRKAVFPGIKGIPAQLDFALLMLKKRFESVRWHRNGKKLTLNTETDL